MLALTLLALAAPQTTWYVDASAAPPGIGTQADPYTRVDFAVAQAATASGDSLLIADGVYPDERIDFSSKQLTLAAAPNANPVLGSTGQDSIIVASAGSRVMVDGIRFEGIMFQSGPDRGGAIRSEGGSVSLTDCSFANCRAVSGGVIHLDGAGLLPELSLAGVTVESSCGAENTGGSFYVDGAEVSVADSELNGFSSYFNGGVFYLKSCDTEVTRTSIDGSAYEYGGGLHVDGGSIVMSACDVEGQSREDYWGGGLYVENGADATVSRCVFHDCYAVNGGAVYSRGSSTIRLVDSYFRNNRTSSLLQNSGRGGAAYIASGTVERCVFIGNRSTHMEQSGGGALAGRMSVYRSTFLNNQGSAGAESVLIYPPASGSMPAVRGCIFAHSSPGGLPPVFGTSTVEYNVSDRPLPGATNVLGDPSFWSDTTLQLLPDSPAIDLLPESFGIDPDGTSPDAGAFTYDQEYCGTGCDGPLGTVSCVAQPNSTGVPSIIRAFGSTDISQDRLVLVVEELPSGSMGYFIASQTASFAPGAGGSSGTLCVGGSVLRFSNTLLTATPIGRSVAFRPLLADLPGASVVTAGDEWFFQLWHRDFDPAGPTSNFSPSLSVQF